MFKDEVKNKLEKFIKDWIIKSPRRIYFTIDKEDIKKVAGILYKEIGMRLSTITGLDNKDNLELIYHFSLDKTGEIFNVRVFIDRDKPQIDSLCDLFYASNWIEREIYEMLGINFIGHPKLERLLLSSSWPEGEYPLRKDYKNE